MTTESDTTHVTVVWRGETETWPRSDFTWPRTHQAIMRGASEAELETYRAADALEQVERMNRAISGDNDLLDTVLLRDATARAYFEYGRNFGRREERKRREPALGAGT